MCQKVKSFQIGIWYALPTLHQIRKMSWVNNWVMEKSLSYVEILAPHIKIKKCNMIWQSASTLHKVFKRFSLKVGIIWNRCILQTRLLNYFFLYIKGKCDKAVKVLKLSAPAAASWQIPHSWLPTQLCQGGNLHQ